jgi:FkbM family methyltransferase
MEMPNSNRLSPDSSRATLFRARATRAGKQALHEVLWRSLGRRQYARLGRFLWMQSRLDIVNSPASNGELTVVAAFARSVASARKVVVCDVGANVGDWSNDVYEQLWGARVGAKDGGVEMHLFEPSPASYAMLEVRLPSWSASARVFISREAIAERQGEATFTLFGPTDGINTLMPLPSDATHTPIAVQLNTLDAYAASHSIERIDFLKIDTEGNDFNVLLGAAELLRAQRIGLLQFEYNHRWIAFRRYLKDAFEALLAAGYSVGKVTPKGIVTFRRWHHELESFREGNYLAWPGGTFPIDLPRLDWWVDS